MKDKLRKSLKESRYIHSIGVCETAVEMAKIYGVDEKKAYVAGLLHDCAKCFDYETQIQMCREFGIVLDEITLACPAVIHAPLGAAMAKAEYGIEDEEILRAIRLHTTGGTNMTKLDKIIYIADMIEPSRRFDGVDELRGMSLLNLDTAMENSLRSTLNFNIQKGTVIHPDTLSAWNNLLLHKESD